MIGKVNGGWLAQGVQHLCVQSQARFEMRKAKRKLFDAKPFRHAMQQHCDVFNGWNLESMPATCTLIQRHRDRHTTKLKLRSVLIIKLSIAQTEPNSMEARQECVLVVLIENI